MRYYEHLAYSCVNLLSSGSRPCGDVHVVENTAENKLDKYNFILFSQLSF